MSILRNGHVALSILGVRGYSIDMDVRVRFAISRRKIHCTLLSSEAKGSKLT